MRHLAMVFVLHFLACVGHAAVIHVDGRNPFARDVNSGTEERPLKTIAAAADRARAGDVVLVHAGTYAETVRLRHSGTPASPIVFRAATPGEVVVTGVDEFDDWAPIRTPRGGWGMAWPHEFAIDIDDGGRSITHHPEEAPLWGRAEQVFVNGVRLKPVGSFTELSATDALTDENLQAVVPEIRDAFGGVYHIHEKARRLIVRIPGEADPNDQIVEVSTRELLFGVTPWDGDGNGVENVHVIGFVFRGAAGFPQRPAVWLHGKNNVVEECVIEDNAGAGVFVNGKLRRSLIQRNGHIGGSAIGDDAVNESTVWVGNSWKPIDRTWEAGGTKVVRSRGGVFRDCLFLRNGGPGLWLDIDVRDMRIERCEFVGNELSGLFIEISREITVDHCHARGNGLATEDWGVGGITVAESMGVTIRNCLLEMNRDGLAVREQGPRIVDTPEGDLAFTVRDLTVEDTVSQLNSQYQLAFWWDNPAFGPHPSRNADDGKARLDPLDAAMRFNHNTWDTGNRNSKLIQWGVPWRPGSNSFEQIAGFQALGFEKTPGNVRKPFELFDADKSLRDRLPAWITERGHDRVSH